MPAAALASAEYQKSLRARRGWPVEATGLVCRARPSGERLRQLATSQAAVRAWNGDMGSTAGSWGAEAAGVRGSLLGRTDSAGGAAADAEA